MSLAEDALLIAGGLAAGIVNTLAGGGSLLTVPLLVLVGLPGTVANGTNRIGVLLQSAAAAWRFRAEGVSGLRRSLPAIVPIALGSVAGSYLITLVSDRTFDRLFGIVMIVLLILILRQPRAPRDALPREWSPLVAFLVFAGVGLYGGAFQAGVGIAIVFALAGAGYDLVLANSVKVVLNTVLTAVAIPVFIARGQVEWWPALLLAAGFALGGELGARLAVRGGERVIRPVMAVSVIALAGRMMGIW